MSIINCKKDNNFPLIYRWKYKYKYKFKSNNPKSFVQALCDQFT